MHRLKRTLAFVLLLSSLLVTTAAAQEFSSQHYQGDVLSFDYPAELTLSEATDLEIVTLQHDPGQISVHVMTMAEFEHEQQDGHDLSPQQSPLEMMRAAVGVLKTLDVSTDASLENVEPIDLPDGRAGLLLWTHTLNEDGEATATGMYALSFPLSDGRTWLVGGTYQSEALAEVTRMATLAIAASIQPLEADDAALGEFENLPQSYQAETIRLRYPEGMRLEDSDGLNIISDKIQFQYAIVSPAAIDSLKDEGVEISSTMSPQAMMIAFVHGLNDQLAAGVSLEEVSELSLSDGHSAWILQHSVPEEGGSIILMTLPLSESNTGLAGVFLTNVPPLFSDALTQQAQTTLLHIAETIQLVEPLAS